MRTDSVSMHCVQKSSRHIYDCVRVWLCISVYMYVMWCFSLQCVCKLKVMYISTRKCHLWPTPLELQSPTCFAHCRNFDYMWHRSAIISLAAGTEKTMHIRESKFSTNHYWHMDSTTGVCVPLLLRVCILVT